jgi:hypothetical protein
MFWFLADHSYYPLSADDDTFITDFFDGWADFHNEERFWILFSTAAMGSRWTDRSIRIGLSEGDTTTSEIIGSELDHDSISWDELDTVFLHFSSYIRTYHHVRESFWKLYFEYGSWEGFQYFTLDFDFIIFRHRDAENQGLIRK